MPSIQELQLRAIEYAKAGDFGPHALATNLELAKLAPTNEGALTRLSRCYMEGGQLDEATATLDAAIQLNSQNTIARSLQQEVTKRRVASMPVIKPQRSPRVRAPGAGPAPRAARTTPRAGQVAGIGRAEFGALGQLAPEAAVEALGSRLEPLLMALNERPFAARPLRLAIAPGRVGRGSFGATPFTPAGVDTCACFTRACAGSRSSRSGCSRRRRGDAMPSAPALASGWRPRAPRTTRSARWRTSGSFSSSSRARGAAS